jgi:ATP-binding cassette subfamily B protein
MNSSARPFDAFLGERGVRACPATSNASEIAITRAMLKNSPLLLLETTSALDAGKRRMNFQAALESAMKDHTTLVIAPAGDGQEG